MEATFYFDPMCPWTWRASRWLTRAAGAREVAVRWRPFSLGILNEKEDPPEQFRAPLAASRRALRVVAALADSGDEQRTSRFYTDLGARCHDGGAAFSDAAVDDALTATGLDGLRPVLDDAGWDAAVRRWHDEAMESAGPGVGSPVLWLSGAPRALHGPILTEVPSEAGSAELFDALLPLLRSDVFYEVKRGRR